MSSIFSTSRQIASRRASISAAAGARGGAARRSPGDATRSRMPRLASALRFSLPLCVIGSASIGRNSAGIM
ncbi:putative polyketide synthase PksJ domain protein [Burkholderia pseudomallei TSV5]|nr:putative polyketide synthase PksJ domain protein [Burkholderia pseudomallei TSV5]